MGATSRKLLIFTSIMLEALTGAAAAVDSPGSPVNPNPDIAAPLWSVGGEWQDDGGVTKVLSSLQGGPVVLTMFYSGCHVSCPVAVEAMQWVENNLPAAQARRCRFVLVTLDPGGDTVAELRRFRAEAGLSAQWTLLRGARSKTHELADRIGLGYKVGEYGISHTSRIVVLDPAGRIVGRQSTAAPGLVQLLGEVELLLAAPAGLDEGRVSVASVP